MPELVRAGLSPDLAEVEALLGASPVDEAKLRAAAAKAGMAGPLGLDPALAPLGALSEAVRRYLAEARAAPMPLGGHVLGQAPDAATTASMVQAMLAGNGAGSLPLDRVMRAIAGDAHALEVKPAAQARDYASRIASAPRETDAVIAALAGRYVAPGPMQDAIRNPDALPAGRNPYTLDVRAVPTQPAWDAGIRLADQMLGQYRAEHGRLPRKVAFVLWSNETAQNGGTNEAQIFHLLGVRPVWNTRGQVVDVAPVDRAALGRPRIDVLVTTSGTYRDHFGDKLALIAKAVKLAAEADEADNPVRDETLARAAAMRAAGVDADMAERRALRRIFSTAPGAYSPSTQFANREGWSPARLNQLYQARLGHAYGDGSDGEADAAAFTANLKRVDAAVFSRSSSAYGLLDTPMPAAYLGGLSMAVRQDSGRTIDAYVANEQSKGEPRVETLERFYGRERDSRYLNPAWIKGMQASGYNGARYMADLADSMLLWDQTRPELVTDRDWEAVRDVYLHDRYKLGLERYFAENNPAARTKLVQTMLDAIDRGAWRADAATRAELERVAGEPPPATGTGAPRQRPAGDAGAAPREPLSPASSTGKPSGAGAPAPISGYELVPSPPVPPIAAPSTGLLPLLLGAALLLLLGGGVAMKPRW
jgi:cobaltochelatase CobN